MTVCQFCELDRKEHKEDAWPIWFVKAWQEIAKELDVFPDPFTFQMFTPEGEVLRSWQGRYLVGDICKECNTGWMSRLENAAKPILIDLMRGKQTVLDKQQQRTLARWSVLKTLVFAIPTPEMDLPAHIYRQFFRKGPSSIAVHLMAAKKPYAGGVAKVRPLTLEPSGGASYQGLIQTGHAVIHVLGHPVRYDRLKAVPRKQLATHFLTIWPPFDRVVWPPGFLWSADQLEQLITFDKHDPAGRVPEPLEDP